MKKYSLEVNLKIEYLYDGDLAIEANTREEALEKAETMARENFFDDIQQGNDVRIEAFPKVLTVN